jgi:xylulokinase
MLWSQIKADVLGVPYVMSTRDDHALLGAAAVAAAGVHAVPSVEETIDRWLEPGQRLEPDRDRHREYAQLFQVYVRALGELRPLFTDLRTIARQAPSLASQPSG